MQSRKREFHFEYTNIVSANCYMRLISLFPICLSKRGRIFLRTSDFPFQPQKTVDVFLERPGNGGFGLLIARDKTLPPPALFIREVTPGGIATKTGLVDKG